MLPNVIVKDRSSLDSRKVLSRQCAQSWDLAFGCEVVIESFAVAKLAYAAVPRQSQKGCLEAGQLRSQRGGAAFNIVARLKLKRHGQLAPR